jgi:hypothetical protein
MLNYKTIQRRTLSFRRFGVLLFILLVGLQNSVSMDEETGGILFPRAIGFTVGQVGWMEGSSLGDEGGPWRAGIRRRFDVRDYTPFVEIGQEVGVRFMSLFILGELDRLNAPARYPTSTPEGVRFDNSRYVGPDQIEIMNYVKSNAAYIEFGITGVMHEFWENGVRTRAEWYDAENKKPRDENIVRAQIELLKEIMAQYDITPSGGHSFPESFIAYAYYWNPEGPYSLGKILGENGVKYANTHFTTIAHLNPPPRRSGGFDHGVLVLDRVNHGNPWYAFASLPPVAPEELETVVVETHWANWLAQDDFLQSDLNGRWIDHMKQIQAHPEYYLAKNTEQLYAQWLYTRYVTLEEIEKGKVIIDARNIPDEMYRYNMSANMVLAVPLGEGEHVMHARLEGKPLAAYFEDGGFGYLYLPPLEQKIYELTYATGPSEMKRYVHNIGTYNVYSVTEASDRLEIDIKMYGCQDVEIRSPEPRRVSTSSSGLNIRSMTYDPLREMVILILEGKDIQGERGKISLYY